MAYDDDLSLGRKSLDGHHAQIVANSSPLKGVEHRVDFIVPKRMIQLWCTNQLRRWCFKVVFTRLQIVSNSRFVWALFCPLRAVVGLQQPAAPWQTVFLFASRDRANEALS